MESLSKQLDKAIARTNKEAIAVIVAERKLKFAKASARAAVRATARRAEEAQALRDTRDGIEFVLNSECDACGFKGTVYPIDVMGLSYSAVCLPCALDEL